MGLSCQFAVTRGTQLTGSPRRPASTSETGEEMGFEGFCAEHHFQGGASVCTAHLAGHAPVPPKPSTLPRHHSSYPSDKPSLSQKNSNTGPHCGRLILGLGRGFDDQLFEVFMTKEKPSLQTYFGGHDASWRGAATRRDGCHVVARDLFKSLTQDCGLLHLDRLR